jgi:hypothetical protein
MRRGWHRFLFTTDSEGPNSHSAQVGIRMRMRLNVHVSMCSYVHVSTCSYVHVSTCSYVHRGRGGTTFSGERPNGRESAWASDFLWASMRASIGLCPASAPPSVPSPSRPIPLSPSPPSPLLRSMFLCMCVCARIPLARRPTVSLERLQYPKPRGPSIAPCVPVQRHALDA